MLKSFFIFFFFFFRLIMKITVTNRRKKIFQFCFVCYFGIDSETKPSWNGFLSSDQWKAMNSKTLFPFSFFFFWHSKFSCITKQFLSFLKKIDFSCWKKDKNISFWIWENKTVRFFLFLFFSICSKKTKEIKFSFGFVTRNIG